MPISLAVVLLAVPGPAIFDQSVAAFRARKSFTVEVALDATMNGKSTSARYRLSYAAPNKVLLSKLANGKPAIVFWLNGPRFIAYDPFANEMVDRPAPTQGPIVNRLANAMGGLDDPITAQLSPDTMAAFLGTFTKLSGWKTSNSPARIAVSRPGTLNGKATLSEFEFESSTKLLTRALLVGPNSRLQWRFSYGRKPATLSFSPPAGAKRVAALTEHPPINASDPKARKLVDQSLRAYARLTSIAYSVTGPDGPSDNWMSGSSFRQRQSRLEWSYVGGVLTLHDLASGRTYRGRCRPSAVLNYLKILNRPMDPVLQALFTHRNPISGWFLPGMVASTRGTVLLGGVSSTAVELRSNRLDVSLLIRGDNQLVASVSSRIKNHTGAVVSDSRREFSYVSVNRRLPPSTFSLNGRGFVPLTRIGR